MGTQVQGNAFLMEYHSVIDLTGSESNGLRSAHQQEERLRKSSYSGHDIEKVRKTIIEHESIFRNQLQELHRLYRRQRELMSEIKKYAWKDKCSPVVPPPQDTRSLRTFEPQFFTSGILPKGTDNNGILSDSSRVSFDGDTKLSLCSVVRTSEQRSLDASRFDFYSKSTNPKDRISGELALSSGVNPCSGFNLVMKDFFPNSLDGKSGPGILGLRNESSGKEHLFEDCIEEGRFDKHYSVKDLFGSGKPLSTEPRTEPSHCLYTTSTSVSRKKRKIFGVEISGDEYPGSTTPCQTNSHIASWVSSSCMKNLDFARKNEKDAKIELNFGNTPYQLTGSDPGKCFKNSVDANSKPIEFQSSSEHPQNGLPWFLINSQVSSDSSKTKKGSYFMNLDSLQNYSEKFFRKAETTEAKLDASGIKVGMAENAHTSQVDTTDKRVDSSRLHIDLNLSLDDEPEVSYEECDKIAANAMLDISSLFTKRSCSEGEESCDLLKWFAETISSAENGTHDESGPVPEGMDDFEIMTLRLEDVKEDRHDHEEVVLENTTSDALVSSKRSRRGRQQRRDFKRDILPGLVTLSRLQVTEDFQAFQELMKAKWGPGRNGRGKKRLGGLNFSPVARSLTGWGRRTKRLPRQRCGSAIIPVKC